MFPLPRWGARPVAAGLPGLAWVSNDSGHAHRSLQAVINFGTTARRQVADYGCRWYRGFGKGEDRWSIFQLAAGRGAAREEGAGRASDAGKEIVIDEGYG